MPITISRRDFLAASLATGVGMALGACAGKSGRQPRMSVVRDPNHLALISDTHINAYGATIDKGNNMSTNLNSAVAEVLAMSVAAPSVVLVNGDCAHKTGEMGDYAQFIALMMPLVHAGLPVHIALGNHDHRERFWSATETSRIAQQDRIEAVKSHQVLVFSTPTTEVIVLDSLEKTAQTPGFLGEEQLMWLKGVLDEPKRAGKPVMVFVHHNPPLPVGMTASGPATTRAPAVMGYEGSVTMAASGPASMAATQAATQVAATMQAATMANTQVATQAASQPTSRPAFIGIRDGEALLELLLPRKQVKALVYGHTHQWQRTQLEGMHVVNIPATAYVFGKVEPTGWTDCRLSERGARLQLRCTNVTHPKHGEVVDLEWRS